MRRASLLSFLVVMLLALGAAASHAASPTGSAMAEFDGWLRPLLDTLINANGSLNYVDNGSVVKVGWLESEQQFWPDGGTGPGAATGVLYQLSGRNPEYTRIANLIVSREAALLSSLTDTLGLEAFAAELQPLLATWDYRTEPVEALIARVSSASVLGFALRLMRQDSQTFFETLIGLPALIDGVRRYSGNNQTELRAVAEHQLEMFALAGSVMILKLGEIGQLGLLDQTLRGMSGMNLSLTVAGSELAKYEIMLARVARQPLYSVLGVAVVDLVQKRVWKADQGQYTGDLWELPQLLETLAHAYRVSRKAELKERTLATFAALSNGGVWNEFADATDGTPPVRMGAYEPWYSNGADVHMQPFLSEVWLYQRALIEWYAVLRLSREATEQATATLFKDRSIYIFRYLRTFMANPASSVMDHDLVIARVDDSGQTSYVVSQRDANWFLRVGCMECNFSVIQNYLRLRQLHPKAAAA